VFICHNGEVIGRCLDENIVIPSASGTFARALFASATFANPGWRYGVAAALLLHFYPVLFIFVL